MSQKIELRTTANSESPNEVTRYNPILNVNGQVGRADLLATMIDNPTGCYVLYTDYAAQAERIAQLEQAMRQIVDDPVLDSDTQRLLRAHAVARAAIRNGNEQ